MTSLPVITHHDLAQAECLYDLADIEHAIDAIAQQLNDVYHSNTPLLLCVMNGALVTMGQLLPKLTFALEVDYIHASRYGDETIGGKIKWWHQPETDLKNRDIILIEDIVDRGDTLSALRDYCLLQQAKSVSCATLVNKSNVDKVCTPAEFVGLDIPNKFVFGFGMDYQGLGRNLPGIYAL